MMTASDAVEDGVQGARDRRSSVSMTIDAIPGRELHELQPIAARIEPGGLDIEAEDIRERAALASR